MVMDGLFIPVIKLLVFIVWSKYCSQYMTLWPKSFQLTAYFHYDPRISLGFCENLSMKGDFNINLNNKSLKPRTK